MKILIFGLPGSGKTTFAKKLVEKVKRYLTLMLMILESYLKIGILQRMVESDKLIV
jgi:adenylate kinase family enzyme